MPIEEKKKYLGFIAHPNGDYLFFDSGEEEIYQRACKIIQKEGRNNVDFDSLFSFILEEIKRENVRVPEIQNPEQKAKPREKRGVSELMKNFLNGKRATVSELNDIIREYIKNN